MRTHIHLRLQGPQSRPFQTDSNVANLTLTDRQSIQQLCVRVQYEWVFYLGEQHLLLSLYLLLLSCGHFLELREGQLHTGNLHRHTGIIH